MNAKTIKIGDEVKLLGVPDWLIHDLPEEEKREIISYIGKTTTVTDIDKYGYFWLGFGDTKGDEDAAYYSGHSFCVTIDCLVIL